MPPSVVDKLNYLRISDGHGGRAEMVRMVYVLAGRPYQDVFCTFAEARSIAVKNPFKQFPFVETESGEIVAQTLAIMHRAAHGTPIWPSDPEALTQALSVALGGYDLYQAFGGFSADDVAAKKKFEERRAPQYFAALSAIYAERDFAAGTQVTFADCIAHEAVGWCVRRNDVCRALFEASAPLKSFSARMSEIPALAKFMQTQATARAADNSV